MANISEGGAVWVSDSSGLKALSLYDASGDKFYGLRADNSTAKNLRVALYDAAGNALLIAGATPSFFQDAAVGTSAAAFASHACVKAGFQADANNTDDVFLGISGTVVWRLTAQSALVVPCTNTNLYFRKSNSGTQTINVIFLN